MSRFPHVLELVQFEKPLYLGVNTDNGFGYVATTLEPVGEQEGV